MNQTRKKKYLAQAMSDCFQPLKEPRKGLYGSPLVYGKLNRDCMW